MFVQIYARNWSGVMSTRGIMPLTTVCHSNFRDNSYTAFMWKTENVPTLAAMPWCQCVVTELSEKGDNSTGIIAT